MKKLLITFTVTLILGLAAIPAFPFSYQFDFAGDQVWDTELKLSMGETAELEIWLDGYSCAPNDMVFGISLYIYLDNLKCVQVNSHTPNTNVQMGGPFDDTLSFFNDLGGGVYALTVSNFNYVTVIDNKILLGKIEVEYTCSFSDGTNITAANHLGFGEYNDGFLSDCNLKKRLPADSVMRINHSGEDDDEEDEDDQSEDEEEEEEETSAEITKTSITTSILVQTDRASVRSISDRTMTTIPETSSIETPRITRKTSHRATVPGKISSAIKEPGSKSIESPESIAKPSPSTSTSTILRPSPFKVLISPSSVTLNSGGVLQFNAKTLSERKEVAGTYLWKIVPGSTIGSTINENGQFTAAINTTNSNIRETIRVTDITKGISTTATLTIKAEKQPPVECELLISPSSATVYPGDTIAFFANKLGKRCGKSSYRWEVNSKIDSQISRKGVYRAGNNESGESEFDLIIVKDAANKIKIDAIVTVLSREKVTGLALDNTQNPQQGTILGRGIYLKVLIIIVPTILLLIGILYKLKKLKYI